MKFSHALKFPFGKRYEMHEFYAELEDTEFPELEGRSILERTRYMQGTLLQMGLVFQAASGYVSPEDEDFKEQMRMALELKKLPPLGRKVTVQKSSGLKNISFSKSPIPEKGHK